MSFLDQRQTTDPGADHDANALGIFVGDFEPAVLHGLNTGCQPVMDKGIHMTRFFGGDIVFDLKPLHFPGKMRGERGRIKFGNGSDP